MTVSWLAGLAGASFARQHAGLTSIGSIVSFLLAGADDCNWWLCKSLVLYCVAPSWQLVDDALHRVWAACH
jgi:hypothetical protein